MQEDDYRWLLDVAMVNGDKRFFATLPSQYNHLVERQLLQKNDLIEVRGRNIEKGAENDTA